MAASPKFKVPVPSASDVKRPAGSRSRTRSGGPLTKRNTLRCITLGAAGAPDVAYQSLDGIWTVQRGDANGEGMVWALSVKDPEGNSHYVGHFATSDLAMNFAAREAGLTDQPLDVTAGKGAKS